MISLSIGGDESEFVERLDSALDKFRSEGWTHDYDGRPARIDGRYLVLQDETKRKILAKATGCLHTIDDVREGYLTLFYQRQSESLSPRRLTAEAAIALLGIEDRRREEWTTSYPPDPRKLLAWELVAPDGWYVGTKQSGGVTPDGTTTYVRYLGSKRGAAVRRLFSDGSGRNTVPTDAEIDAEIARPIGVTA